MAVEDNPAAASNSGAKVSNELPGPESHGRDRIVGILNLVRLKHPIFGHSLISLPFFDFSGILADNPEAAAALVGEAVSWGEKLKVGEIELRNLERLEWDSMTGADGFCAKSRVRTQSNKVRMVLELPDSADALMKSFKSKLRSQIRRPQKEGIRACLGGLELLKDFYDVFATNMRDLGSPVHSKRFIETTLKVFPENARLVVVYKEKRPLACSLIFGFKDTLENPWASSLRRYGRLSPNMLLYWTMLEYACENGYRRFDFGRSSPEEGTFKFKQQWGAEPVPLYWQHIAIKSKTSGASISDDARFQLASEIWKRLPLRVTTAIGPRIRKHIGL
jgi:FemAB-related protein (PEP-CTERM system-associated)